MPPRSSVLTTLWQMVLNRLRLRLDARGDPATPGADSWVLYVRSSDSALCAKDDTGAVVNLGSGGGGVTDHTALTSLAWASSDHTGTAGRLAGFDGSGAAENTAIGSGLVHSAGTLAVDFGTGAGEVCEGDDARLSDDRNPTAHASSHLSAGSDPVLSLSLAASLGLQLDTLRRLPIDFARVFSAWSHIQCLFANNATTVLGQAAPSALGSAGTSGGFFMQRSGTAGVGMRQGQRLLYRSAGFFLSIRFRRPAAIDPLRLLIGLSDSTETDSDTVPSGFVGIFYSSVRGDSGPLPTSRDAGSQTDGTALAALVADHWHVLTLYQARGGSTVYVELFDETAGTVDTDTITATLPSTATALGWVCAGYNRGTSGALDIAHVDLWVDMA